MDLKIRIEIFKELRRSLQNLSPKEFSVWTMEAEAANRWFTEENVKAALEGIIYMLEPERLTSWISAYKFPGNTIPKRIGVVMPGNIPFAGFHDMLAVLISGHRLYAKLSSQDTVLMKKIVKLLTEIEPDLSAFIHFPDRLTDIHAVIATGSDNSAKYFNYYFSSIPHIIRKNRTSVAVLSNQDEDWPLLAKDIFMYFGLGCRNISRIFVPEGFSFPKFFESMSGFSHLIHHSKYVNNYEYRKSILLLNQVPHLDNGFLLLEENEALVSPIGVLYYEYYREPAEMEKKLALHKEKLQVIVSEKGWFPGSLPFGLTQQPGPADYADGVDTIDFLLKI